MGDNKTSANEAVVVKPVDSPLGRRGLFTLAAGALVALFASADEAEARVIVVRRRPARRVVVVRRPLARRRVIVVRRRR